MVFSQTSQKTHSILKVVEIDRLKANQSQQVNSPIGLITDGSEPTLSSMPSTSYMEVRHVPAAVYLKEEPLIDTTMYHEPDSEFFQDLVQWCSTSAKEEQVHTIEYAKDTEKRAHYDINTPHTQSSPLSWDVFDVKSPTAMEDVASPSYLLSPNLDGLKNNNCNNDFTSYPIPDLSNKATFSEQFIDISSLPIVVGDLSSDTAVEHCATQHTGPESWPQSTYTDYTKTHKMPFIEEEDSLDLRLMATVIPQEIESNGVVVSEYLLSEPDRGGVLHPMGNGKRGGGLSVNLAPPTSAWLGSDIHTPDIITCVEQLENSHYIVSEISTATWPSTVTEDTDSILTADTFNQTSNIVDYEPITPKSESSIESEEEDVKSHIQKKRRRDSDDSDVTYTPYKETTTTRGYKRRKPNVSIKEMITAIEGSQQLPKARRGRPPKRRDSNVSSVCSIDDQLPNHENKYRELREKNNEASKRSRMNRKLKELQMEQMAIELEERNKKLKVRADILEDMTKKLKDALMTAILKK